MTSASAQAFQHASGCPVRDQPARREQQQQDQRESAGGGHRQAAADGPAPAAPESRCPVEHNGSSSPFLNPLNNIPAGLSQQPSPGQKISLPTERSVSSIPRGRLSPEETGKPQAEGEVRGGEAYGLGDKWEYPSPQQFYNALKRKVSRATEQTARACVSLVAPGGFFCCPFSERVRSSVKIERPSKVARLTLPHPDGRGIAGNASPRPFDRHDWVVDRCGRHVRYVIDYYSAPEEPGNAPAFYLDVRPALDSPEAFLSRAKAGFWNAYERFTGRTGGNEPQ
ncbi:MAG: cytochrome c/c1 heme lyase-domain-containing protein [Olpidium bornovanus]|uniref:Holocytochrome c-type synthase n=1 Tax=Olpidium bornovanus TaxID=278681 RepID=A0A8H7ZWB2_9FUNG|nr:MAG: cytochrome c/c1 heme lyase-domain-containing protein [Olpidium bornovanus]